MKTVIRKLYIILFLLVVALNLFAQDNYFGLEYIENKGQWDKQVTFKSNLNGGAIFLRKTGFTILQHNQQDLTAILESVHGHGPKGGKNSNASDTAKPSANSRLAFPTPGSENGGGGGGGSSSPGITTLRSHAYTLEFEGSNQNPVIIPEKAQDTYNNYFIGDDPSKWKSNCKIYQAITYKDVYPGIDIRYYSEAGWVKYEFIVNPGADPSKIVMNFNGVDKLGVNKNELVISTSVGEIRELSPYTYQVEDNTRKKLSCKYVVEGNKVRFKIAKYSSQAPLIIDPTLIFASLSGSTADNWGYTATYGRDGSLYGGGIVFGPGFPTNTGAFQTTYAPGGEFDMGIIKLNSAGTSRIYATYIGGSGKEQPHSMFEDAQGNLVIAGRTTSPNYPALTSFGTPGGWDIVVTKLNGNGSALIGSMRISGSGDDGVNTDENREAGRKNLLNFYGDDARSEVILDPAGNIYVTSSTKSTNFYTTPSAPQKTLGGAAGDQDAVLIKINPTVSTVLSSTYFGGDGYDAGFVLARDPSNGNIYMAGGTASTNIPGNKSGVIQPAYKGGATANGPSDGYIAVFAPDASTLIRSTYLGTSSIDVIFGIQFDKFNFPYVMGVTMGNEWPVVNATFSNPRSKQFVGKLKEDLSGWEFSTVFGSGSADPNISPVAFLVDRCQNMYISGWGGDWGNKYAMSGVAGMPTTPDAIKSNPGDNKDFYFIVIKRNATQVLYGSFFGQNGPIGEHVDGGTSRYDQNGTIYQGICANCGGASAGGSKPRWPVTPGAWCCSNGLSASKQGGQCNLGMVKIAFNFAGVAAGVRAYINGIYDTTGCVPMDVIFRDTIRNAQNYIWNFGDGSPDSLTSSYEVAHTYMAIGDYRVRLIAIDSNSCNFKDTAYVTIRVRDNKALVDFSSAKIGECLSNNYRFTNLSTPAPGLPFGKSFSWDFGDGVKIDSVPWGPIDHSFAKPGTYNVSLTLIDTSYCNAPEVITKQLRVSPLVKAQFEIPNEACAPFTAVFENTTLGGQTFLWDFGDGTISNAIYPTHVYNTPGSYTVKLMAIDPSTCNLVDSTQQTIIVRDAPTAAFSYTPTVPTENITHIFTNASSPDAIRFEWDFGDGEGVMETTSRADVDHEYNSTGIFNACLYAYNKIGCVDSACLPVQTLVSARLDLPNAFTPTGPNNNVFYVRGFAIGKMRFIIYNRWGQKVFESNSKNQGWDGKFNGVMQPMDVYAYTIEVEFTDGTRATKKGDITLIR